MNNRALEPTGVDELVGRIADEFTQRLNQGEQPDVEEYARRYPDAAAVLREVLTALLFVRVAGPDLATAPSPLSPAAGNAGCGVGKGEGAALRGCLGDYRILREVGRGGMGVVYEAEQISLSRRVALKVLPFAATLDPKQMQRFQIEAKAAAHLHHQNIVPIYAVGCERGVHYYAMQFVEGQTIASLIHEERRRAGLDSKPALSRSDSEDPDLTIAEPPTGSASTTASRPTAVGPAAPTPAPAAMTTVYSCRDPACFRAAAHLGIQAAEGLEHAHQRGVLHRDIKPANILVDGGGHLWITDFGLARLQGDATLTLTGDLIGTLRYMSPEQAQAQRVLVDHRTDVYSLGTTLYELLTLRPAFGGSDRQELLRRIAVEEPPAPRRLDRTLPAELETIILKAMAKNPDERFATAQELADDLQRYLDDKPIWARRPTWRQLTKRWARRHRPVVIAAAVAAVLALLMAVGILAVSNEQISKAQQRAVLAERQRTEQLRQSLLIQAQAARFRRQGGQRFASLPPMRQAAELVRSLKLGDDALLPLRNEAIACLALADVNPVGSLPARPANEYWMLLMKRSHAMPTVMLRELSPSRRLMPLPVAGSWRRICPVRRSGHAG
jgi:serine/threonine protein kinase